MTILPLLNNRTEHLDLLSFVQILYDVQLYDVWLYDVQLYDDLEGEILK